MSGERTSFCVVRRPRSICTRTGAQASLGARSRVIALRKICVGLWQPEARTRGFSQCGVTILIVRFTKGFGGLKLVCFGVWFGCGVSSVVSARK